METTKPKVLHLTLKKKWFDMIDSGEKKEEYRDIKPHWIKRLTDSFTTDDNMYSFLFQPKEFDTIEFRNGYAKDAKKLRFEFGILAIRKGRPEWGAEPGKKYFVIKLGEKL